MVQRTREELSQKKCKIRITLVEKDKRNTVVQEKKKSVVWHKRPVVIGQKDGRLVEEMIFGTL
jgi:hypothetical protein